MRKIIVEREKIEKLRFNHRKMKHQLKQYQVIYDNDDVILWQTDPGHNRDVVTTGTEVM